MSIAEELYYSLLGLTADAYKLPWVECVFVPGSSYYKNYTAVLDAYERLCRRLAAGEDDRDVEIIINALLDNQKDISLKMFEYGQNKPHP